MALILQANLGRGRLAQDLLDQFARDRGVGLLFISEQYRTLSDPGWYSDRTGTAAVVVLDRAKFHVSDTGAGDGFVWVACGRITYFSCYLSPNMTIGDFRRRLAALEVALRMCRGSCDLVLAGDLNSKATAWGETHTDPRGRAVLEMAASLDLIVLNSRTTATFRRIGTRGSVVDVTLASPRVAARVSAWAVLEDYTASDHQYVSFRIGEHRVADQREALEVRASGWNVARLDREALREALAATHPLPDTLTVASAGEAELLVERNMRLIRDCCDACMPKRSTRSRRRPSYW